MSKTILITGGAGFVSSFVAEELLENGYHVRAFDDLDPQVHGFALNEFQNGDRNGSHNGCHRPSYLHPDVELIKGDIRDREAVKRSLRGIDAVFHLAALVGVGQSMYQIERYTSVNNVGTAVLLEALIENPVERLVVASSMSVYGEGLYRTRQGNLVGGAQRSVAQLQAHDWELRDENGDSLTPVPTPESKTPTLASVYALSKYDQERLCLLTGQAYGFESVALRFFNIYGPRQALSNPYTGVLAIFAARYLNNRPPLINEDGFQQRDFVHVRDIARACRLALEHPKAAGEVFNIGSGTPRTVRAIADELAQALDKAYIEPEIVSKYRVGDIRHCYADISKARRILGYEPQVELQDGLQELAAWLEGQVAIDMVESAGKELASRGLTI